MSFFSQFAGGPAKVTQYTSGSGNYTPISTTQSWARVTVVGGGGAGFSNGSLTTPGSGGGAGSTVTQYIKLNEASYAYVVGAGGTPGNAGSGTAGNAGGRSYFGNIIAFGGSGAADSNNRSGGGVGATFAIFAGGPVLGVPINGIFGIGLASGGQGGVPNQRGSAAGYNGTYTNYIDTNTIPNTYGSIGSPGGNIPGSNGAGGAGGDTLYGIGGTGGNGNWNNTAGAGAAGTGYGSGGGGCGTGNPASKAGDGAGGLIIIEEFVQA